MLYNKHINSIEKKIKNYKNKVQKGEDLIELQKWNHIIVEKLNINNMQLFFPDYK